MQICFVISAIIIIASIIMTIKFKENLKTKIVIIIISSIAALAILVFPFMEENNNTFKVLDSVFYSLKCLGLNQDFSIISNIDLLTINGFLYAIFIYGLFLALPILTASVILIFLGDMFVKVKFAINKNKRLYIFSEMNEKSLMVARRILKRKGNMAKIVFTNFDRERNREDIKALKITDKILDLKIGNENKVTFYLISENEEENLENALELITKYHNRDKTKIYVVNNSDVATVILDSSNKGKINVEIINETERMVYDLLDRIPLYLNAEKNKISVLIVGCGRVGQEFLKTAVWCGQIIGYELEINVIDINSEKIKEKLEIDNPELLNNYNINFIDADIKSKKAEEEIQRLKSTNYVFVSMESDEKNIDTAILLRKIFLKNDKENFNRRPIINLWIDNESKKERINKLVNERNNSYNLNAFGSIKDMYYDNCIINSKLESLAKQVHLSYNPKDTTLKQYNLLEYNKCSSRATALHLKYKLFSVLKDKYTNNLEEDLKNYEMIVNDEVIEKLSENEHERWNAYTRSIGYTTSSIEDVKKYIKNTGDYRHFLAMLHPALVDYKDLDSVSESLSKLCNKEINLKENDRMIIRNMPEILKNHVRRGVVKNEE